MTSKAPNCTEYVVRQLVTVKDALKKSPPNLAEARGALRAAHDKAAFENDWCLGTDPALRAMIDYCTTSIEVLKTLEQDSSTEAVAELHTEVSHVIRMVVDILTYAETEKKPEKTQ